MLKRPNISFAQIAEYRFWKSVTKLGDQIEIAVKYAGYINRQHEDVAQMKRLEETQNSCRFLIMMWFQVYPHEITLKLKDVRPGHWLWPIVFQG